MTAREAVALSLKGFEGVDSNEPHDRGGLTHYGLTLKTYQDYKPGATWEDLKALTFDQVVDVITELFALRPGFWKIADQWVMWAVIDCSINSGPAEATKELQRAIGANPDGIFGRQTEMALSALNPERVFRRVIANRVRHFGQLIRKDHTQADFAGGWFERAAEILEVA